ncbi:MAG: hypothetical protein CL677_09395 [Bdellovibrionaceae bacterium]|nr:hypothetical protein [Pseudobdellovibrionaceae bacterium]|tara:strand:+ start:14694 stop:15353 length:660 start_codon:yes stop_codon:yes gene_type:complete
MELIIFDCDGTLVDSESIAAKVLPQYWATQGVHVTATEFKERFIGKSNDHPDCVQFFDQMPPQVVEEGDRLWSEALKEQLEPVEGMFELLSSLSLPLCVGSNSSLPHVKHSLKKTGLDVFFGDNVYSARQVANPKPAPDLFLHISQTHNTHPEKCVVIEDSTAGVKAAQNAGIPVVGFSGAAHFVPSLEDKLRETEPDWFCSSTKELDTLLHSWGAKAP